MKKQIILCFLSTCLCIQGFCAVDLIISGGVVPNGMTRGTTYPITIYVQNTGSTSTTISFYVNISINNSSTYNGSQTYLTDIFVSGGIAAGQTKTLNTNITIPCSYAAGTRYILAGADATNLISESNETNNNFNFPFLNRNLNTPLPNSPTNITQTSFQANWQTIPEATSYTLLVALNNTFTNILPGYNNLNVGNVTSRVVSGLNCNTNYYYRVQAVNSCGSSPAVTSEQIATTSACSCPAQTAPTANAASNQSQTGFRANWNTASGASGYRLDVSTSNTFASFVSGYNNLDVGNTTSRDVTGLTCNTTYYYRLRAYNSCGNTSSNSSTINTSTTTCTCPTQTAPIANAASNQLQTGFRANWSTASGASGYRLDVSTSNTFGTFVSGYNNLDVGNVTSLDITGLTCNTTYYYRIRAYNSCGNNSSNSATITTSTTTCTCPTQTAPTANAASNQSQTGFRANWNTASGASGYRLDVSTSNTFGTFVSGYNNLDVGNVTSLDVTGLTCNTTYYYRIRAYNSCGNNSSNSATITTSTTTCTCPTQTAPTANAASNQSQTGFRANWSAASGASGYRLDVSTSSTFSTFISGYNNLDVGNTTSRDVTGLTCNTTYYYRLRAYNSCGNISGNTSTTTAITSPCICTPPPAPTNLTAIPISSSQINLNWNNVSTATGYDVFLCNGNYLGYVAAPSTSFIHTGLSPNTTYSYKIQAQQGGASCISPQTNCVNATTLNTTTNPVPSTPITSPLPSLPNTFIYQSALPDFLYNASINPPTCRPKYKCSEVFLYQNPQNPNSVSQANELIPYAIECFTSYQNSWDFRQRGFITGNNGIMCNTLTCNPNSSVISHSQNACASKDDRYAWDMNLIAGNDAGTCVFAIEDGIVVAPRGNHNICLEHTNSNNQKWYSWYDNINPNNNLVVGSIVLKKAHLGHIGNHIAAPHLHFGIYYKDATGKLISVNRQISPNTTNLAGNPYTITNINGTCTGSIIRGAKIYFKKEGEWFTGGNTDENGKFQFKTIPGLVVGDSIRLVANGYESFSIRITSSNTENLYFKFPMIKASGTSGVTNPIFYAKNNSAFFSIPTIPIYVLGSNYNFYSVFKISNSEESDNYIPVSLNHSNLDTLINIPLTDTGENKIGVFYYGIDTILISKSFYYNPISTNSYNVTINADANASQALMYVNNSFIKAINQQSESFKLLPFESKITFSKLGYLDTTFIVAGNTSINLKMAPIKPEEYSTLDSSIINFIENGKVQHWKRVTLMDSSMKNLIAIKQFEKSYSEFRLLPKSRTFEFSNLNSPIWANIKFLAILDQTTNISQQDIYLLNIIDGNKYFKIPFNSSNSNYDSAFQKLSYNYINFQNGIAKKEAIIIMKKQPPVIIENPGTTILMNDTLILPLSLFVSDPDNLKNDLTTIVNNISVPNTQFKFTIVDSNVHIKSGNNFTGEVLINITATHDFSTVTKTIKLKVAPPKSGDVLSIYPNPGSSTIIADLLLTGGQPYSLNMYDIQGRLIKTFFNNKIFSRGHYTEILTISEIPSGTYLFKLNDLEGVKFIKVTTQ